MTLTESLTIASTLIAALGIFAAVYQLVLLNGQARYERRVAYDGVAVSWYPLEAPYRAGADGNAQWQYEITVTNPGRLPIDRVEVRWMLPCKVRRVHDGKVVEEPVTEMKLVTPVLAGGASRVWKRRIELPYSDRECLSDTYAVVEYTDIDHERHSNPWPRQARRSG